MSIEVMECPECGELMYLYECEDGNKKWCCHNVGCNYEEYDGES